MDKKCSKCGNIKSSPEFYTNDRYPDGFDCWCRGCRLVYGQSYYQLHKSFRVKMFTSGEDEFGNILKFCQRCEQYKQLPSFGRDKSKRDELNIYCKECCAKYIKEWSKSNRLLRNRYDRTYYHKHPKVIERKWRKRRTAKLSSIGSHTNDEWLELCHQHGNACVRCGRTGVKLTRDHIIPLGKDGSTDFIDNIQPLCRSCNAKKARKTIDYRPLSS